MHISELNSLRTDPMIRFKEEEVDGQLLTIVHYMVSNSELWTNPAALEARGNVYTETGECICACFRKFFNVNERPETQVAVIKDHISQCQEKIDGSLVAPILSKLDRIVFKSKKSFYSDLAILARQTASQDVLKCSRFFLEQGFTPLFEFTHPDAKIVLDYGSEPRFTLLAVRSFKTGRELSYTEIQHVVEHYHWQIPVINTFDYSWIDVQERISTEKGIEGFVLILDTGDRVKIKTEEYLRLHRIHTEIRERDIAEAVVNETLDDILGVVTQSNLDRSKITEIESQVISELNQINREITAIVSGVSGLSIKEVAMSLQGSPLFTLVMQKIRNKEPSVIDYWKKNFLKNYSLRCVYNSNF